tara:strand:+ start:1064 stop:1465 length:402 start_codon:yes stop_codon:yes gene_type:complete
MSSENGDVNKIDVNEIAREIIDKYNKNEKEIITDTTVDILIENPLLQAYVIDEIRKLKEQEIELETNRQVREITLFIQKKLGPNAIGGRGKKYRRSKKHRRSKKKHSHKISKRRRKKSRRTKKSMRKKKTRRR